MKISVQADTIKALLIVAAKNDIRYYLNGVCVDARANGDVVLVATDGHRMLMVPMAVADVEDLVVGEFIIPREALASIKPCKAGRTTLPLQLQITVPAPTPDPERPGVMLKAPTSFTITGATSATGLIIDGKYPDWRKVVPASTTGEAGVYNPDYVGDFGAVKKLLSGNDKPPMIHQSGSNSALVSHLGANALGVLMPVRVDADDMKHPGLPAWALKG